jgi:hypothetical protein
VTLPDLLRLLRSGVNRNLYGGPFGKNDKSTESRISCSIYLLRVPVPLLGRINILHRCQRDCFDPLTASRFDPFSSLSFHFIGTLASLALPAIDVQGWRK